MLAEEQKRMVPKLAGGTIQNYLYLQKALEGFAEQSTFDIKIYVSDKLSQNEKEQANRYYKKFYKAFTDYMYNKMGYYEQLCRTDCKMSS